MLDVKKIRLILELRETGIFDSNILSAIEKIPREKFIPYNFRNQAYDNIALPIGDNQTISQPFVVAKMTQLLEVQPKFKILEINQESEKIRLGIKQLTDDPFEFFMNKNVSDVITAIVASTSKSGVYVNIGSKNLPFLIKKNHLAKETENARPSRFAQGDKVDAMIIELDKNKKKVVLSIKALEEKQTKEAVKKYGSKDSGGVLGEILGPLMKKKNKK